MGLALFQQGAHLMNQLVGFKRFGQIFIHPDPHTPFFILYDGEDDDRNVHGNRIVF